jgi:hypothetical protein
MPVKHIPVAHGRSQRTMLVQMAVKRRNTRCLPKSCKDFQRWLIQAGAGQDSGANRGLLPPCHFMPVLC